MSYVADMKKVVSPKGQIIGNGQCVTFVHAVVPTPPASRWRSGAKLRGDMTLKSGTVIATFDADGSYGNHLNGRSHAAIYLGQNSIGIPMIRNYDALQNVTEVG